MHMQGGVVAASAFVPPGLVEKMRADALALEAAGEFASSGLSNSARGTAQAFGEADRIVRAIRPDLGGDPSAGSWPQTVAALQRLQRGPSAIDFGPNH